MGPVLYPGGSLRSKGEDRGERSGRGPGSDPSRHVPRGARSSYHGPVAQPELTAEQRFARTDAIGRLIAFAIAALVLGGSLGVSFLVSPEDIGSGRVALSPTCNVKRLFGRECPTCGLTRAFSALSRGRYSESLEYNRGGPLVYGVFWLGALVSLGCLARAGRDLCRAQRGSRAGGGLG